MKEDSMHLSRRSFAALIALLLLLTLGTPAFAKATRIDVTVSRTSQLSHATLGPGDYEMVVDSNKVTFRSHGKVVAEANGEWKKGDSKAPNTFFVYSNDDHITEIHLRGRDSFLVIG
jgi:hypothetical protein